LTLTGEHVGGRVGIGMAYAGMGARGMGF